MYEDVDTVSEVSLAGKVSGRHSEDPLPNPQYTPARASEPGRYFFWISGM